MTNNVEEIFSTLMATSPDKDAFLRLIRENKKIIFKICYSYSQRKEDRDDLAQEIVYQLWKSFASYKPGFRFSTWMYRVALNTAISFYRKEKKSKKTVSFEEALMEFGEDPQLPKEEENKISLLQYFIGGLKEIDRSIIILYLEDKNYKEIAEITGITESNVGTRMNRIRETLRNNFSTIKI